MLKELACIERALNISMSLFFYFNSLYFFMNNKSLVCLFILLLQHICSSSESESESDKRKSKRMLKEKANRYKTQVLCHHDTVYCSILKKMTCCNKNKSTCLSKQLFRGSNCTHVLYKQGCFCLHLFKPGSHLQHNDNMIARSHKHTGYLYANVLYHQYEHYM